MTHGALLSLVVLMVPSGVDPEDAKRLEDGVYRYLSERSSLGKKFTEEERRAIARASRKSFERHPRKFSREDVELYLESLTVAILRGRGPNQPPSEEMYRKWAREAEREEKRGASSLAYTLQWKERNGEKAAFQVRELADHAAREFQRLFERVLGGFAERDTARECLLSYMKHLTGVSYKSVPDAFRGWLLTRLNNALRLGNYRRLWPDDGQRVKDWSNMEEIRSKVKDGTLEEKKLRITDHLLRLRKGFDQGITDFRLLKLMWKAQGLTGKAREREMHFIGSLIVAGFFYPILERIL